MKINEIVWEDGKQYIDTTGEVWTVYSNDLYDKYDEFLTKFYNIKAILKMEFEEVVDWGKVEVDTPIWVEEWKDSWRPRHFSKYKGGEVFYWVNGGTSHSTQRENCCLVKNVSLTKPKEVQ